MILVVFRKMSRKMTAIIMENNWKARNIFERKIAMVLMGKGSKEVKWMSMDNKNFIIVGSRVLQDSNLLLNKLEQMNSEEERRLLFVGW
jgi:hypothetical protein